MNYKDIVRTAKAIFKEKYEPLLRKYFEGDVRRKEEQISQWKFWYMNHFAEGAEWASEQTYLKANFLKVPDVVDMNRRQRGDYYQKPTAYWFWNCKPTSGKSYQNDKPKKTIMDSKGASRAGLCSEERSMISPDYARNFICDFILGKTQNQKGMQLSLF